MWRNVPKIGGACFMAKEIKIILPPMGEGITDARITRWLVKVGDKVDTDWLLRKALKE